MHKILQKSLPVLLSIAFSTLFIQCRFNSNYTTADTNISTVYKNNFAIGVAVNKWILERNDTNMILGQFNSITAENCMKPQIIQPKQNQFNFTDADKIVNFATRNNLKVRGHCLVWHQQTAEWFFYDQQGNLVSKDTLYQRMETHINTVMQRYGDKVYCWDVVNEAIDDDSTAFLRENESLHYKIAGPAYIAKAFELAHKANPKALLFYNDYNVNRPEKLNRIFKLVKQLVDSGVPIHGVGMQAHWSIYEPTRQQLEQAIDTFASLGLQVHITELDVSVYPWEKHHRPLKPDETLEYDNQLQLKHTQQYNMIFDVLRAKTKNVTSVTFWGICDKYSWLNYYPVRGRKNYPLLFDENMKPKPAFYSITNF